MSKHDTHFHRSFLGKRQSARRHQLKAARRSSKLTVRRAATCDPSGTNDSYTAGHAADPSRGTSDTRIRFRFRTPTCMPPRMSLAAPYRCSNEVRRTAPLCLLTLQSEALEWCDCTCRPATSSSRDSRNNRRLVRRRVGRIDRLYGDQRRSRHISCCCSHTQPIGTRSFANFFWRKRARERRKEGKGDELTQKAQLQ